MSKTINVTVWNEFRHEKIQDEAAKMYPKGIHMAIHEFLSKEDDFEIKTATLDEVEHGLTDEVLDSTDVLLWWGHMAHNEVSDEIVNKVYNKVLNGMGLIVLHSGHNSKIFKKLMGTSCGLRWREAAEKERLWIVCQNHPITKGLPIYFEVEKSEMYGEKFDIPKPDQLLMISWFEGGEVFRSACCYERGMGKIFYFRPGHETYPVYYQSEIQKVLINAIRWAYNTNGEGKVGGHIVKPLEKIKGYEH